MERELRQNAIKRYLEGESPKSIYTDLNRSKNWFFKWLNRFKSGDPQ
jgi:transposase